jgi:hypothetical protein
MNRLYYHCSVAIQLFFTVLQYNYFYTPYLLIPLPYYSLEKTGSEPYSVTIQLFFTPPYLLILLPYNFF